MKTLELDDAVILGGGAVKSLGDGRIGGYLVRFSTADDPDLEGDFFTAETDFGPHAKSLVFYGHGQDKKLGKKVLDNAATLKADDTGIWVEAQLDVRDRYAKAMIRMAEQGKLGWSSGSAPHLVDRETIKGKNGDANWVKSWPLGLDASLTPCPVEPRTVAVAAKGLTLPDFEEVALKSLGMSADDKARVLQGALNVKVRSGGTYQYCWIADIFDATLVYVLDDGDGDTDWFEAPYTFSGTEATIGDATPVVRTTKYLPAGGDSETKEAKAFGGGGRVRDAIAGEWSAKSLKPVSDFLKDLSASRFVDHSHSVRTAVKEYATRVQDYVAIRGEQSRKPSTERLEEFEEIRTELKAVVDALDSLLAPATTEPKKADPDTVAKLREEAKALNPADWL